MKAKISVSVKKIILSAASLSVSITNFSQSCPLSAGDYKLNTHSAAEANIVKRTESGGVTYNRLWCPYKAPGQPDISFYVNWVTNVPNNKFTYTWTCMSLVSKDIINAGNKQAYATFGGYQVNDDYRRGLLKPLAEKILQEVYPVAAPCPNNAIGGNNNEGVQPGNNSGNNNNTVTKETLCRQSAEKLVKLSMKKSEIETELQYLSNHEQREALCREQLSYMNRVIAALNTPGYNGIMKRDVDRFNNAEYRVSTAKILGVNSTGDAISVARAIREVFLSQLDYLTDAPQFISRLTIEKHLVELDIVKTQTGMGQRQCGGRYDVQNCNIAGKWEFVIYRDRKKEYEETWEFSPSGEGRYKGYNTANSNQGDAEVYGKEMILRSATDKAAATYKVELKEFCNSGRGVKRISGSGDSVTILASRKMAENIFYIEDKLYNVTYNENGYQGLYKKGTYNGVPIDAFYFKIFTTNGYHAEQEGEKLWGRFVRKPSIDHPDQSAVQWWFVTWSYENDKWIVKEKEIATPPKIR